MIGPPKAKRSLFCQELYVDRFVNHIKELIMADGRFEPPELIVAVKILYYSSNYLDEFLDILASEKSRWQKKTSTPDKRLTMDESFNNLSELILEVRVKTKATIDDMIQEFSEKQGEHFKTLLKREIGKRSGGLILTVETRPSAS